ncbi:glycosyltransferase family 4 protein [Parahaliea aestuarii]|uniref:Glycosyltransferase family 4 protein n=1 Tax=Parahaliea aestuarii TaxID=1852021 RepID=A0A5C9A0Y7_9GAMM|nr:glycosyltransferase family 4 protein [Parahaliea aestuarii]TXS94533.1 glycosyltransferase family 4 protein [Parahaliea aestuarii]
MSDRSALVMCLADPASSGRPNRFVCLLQRAGFVVDTLSYQGVRRLPVRHGYKLIPPGKGRGARFLRILNSIAEQAFCRLGLGSLALQHLNDLRYGLTRIDAGLANQSWDMIVVQDLQLLPLALRLKRGAKIIFDAREYYPKQNEEKWSFRWFEAPQRTWMCRRYLPQCDKLLTVSPGLANAYRQEFGVEMQLFRSVSPYVNIEPSTGDGARLRMVHHGIANSNRGLEKMIEVVERLDERFCLDFYLVGPERNIDALKARAASCDRIRFLKPVPFQHIVSMLNEYDLGFYYLEPSGFNVTYNLPNKFFEFIQARLAVAIGPSPDMKKIVEEQKLGFVANNFSIDAMVDRLNALSLTDVRNAKSNCHQAARILCLEEESQSLLAYILR